jgi:hypothetical protein
VLQRLNKITTPSFSCQKAFKAPAIPGLSLPEDGTQQKPQFISQISSK